MLEKWSRCHCKTKISATLKFSSRIATFLVFQPKKFFENSLNTFDDIAFLLGQCRGKIEIFHFLDVGKVVTLLVQKQNDSALEIFNHNSHLPHLSAKKNFFENSLNTFEVITFLLGQCKGKIEIFTFSGCWKIFNVAIAKPKYLCTWNFQRQ